MCRKKRSIFEKFDVSRHVTKILNSKSYLAKNPGRVERLVVRGGLCRIKLLDKIVAKNKVYQERESVHNSDPENKYYIHVERTSFVSK